MAAPTRRPVTIYLPPMWSNEVVGEALRQVRDPSPEYVKAVIRAYIDHKQAKYRTKLEIHSKLMLLERQFPEYIPLFAAVRAEKGLPPSRADREPWQPGFSRQTSSSAYYQSRTPSQTISRTSDPTPGPRTVRAASHSGRTSTFTTVRPTPVEGNDDDAPPPYAREDPEPESTRILEQRLAAEAENGASTSSAALTRPDPPISQPASVSPAGNPSRSPRSSFQSSRPPATSPSGREEGSGALTPQRVPSDAELRRIWEESQLDEATRMSVAAERERQELEAAMQLSLAEAEQERSSSGDYEQQQGHSGGAAPSGKNSDTGGRSTAASPPARAGSAMPGGWTESSVSKAGGSSRPNPTSLMDEDEGESAHQLDVPMLSPMKTGTHLQSRNPFLFGNEVDEMAAGSPSSPSRTTADRTGAPTNESRRDTVYGYPTLAFPQTPQTQGVSQVSSSSARGRIPSDVSLRDSPGSGYTSYSPGVSRSSRSGKPLPSAPGPGGIESGSRVSSESQGAPSQTMYAPPPGAPPPHLRVATPPPDVQPQQHEQPNPLSQTSHLPAFTQGISSRSVPPLPPRKPAEETQAGGAHQGHAQNGVDLRNVLKGYDTVFLINDSAVVAGDKWESAQESIIGVAEIAAKYDNDGIDVYFVNSKRVGRELKTRDDVEDLFAGLVPRGTASTGARVEAILREYMGRLERAAKHSHGQGLDEHEEHVKPLHLVVVTGEVPSGDPRSVIVSYAKRLDKGEYPLPQVRIQFFQIGNDAETREALQALDEGLAEEHGIRDMVDIVSYAWGTSAEAIIKGLFEGISGH